MNFFPKSPKSFLISFIILSFYFQYTLSLNSLTTKGALRALGKTEDPLPQLAISDNQKWLGVTQDSPQISKNLKEFSVNEQQAEDEIKRLAQSNLSVDTALEKLEDTFKSAWQDNVVKQKMVDLFDKYTGLNVGNRINAPPQPKEEKKEEEKKEEEGEKKEEETKGEKKEEEAEKKEGEAEGEKKEGEAEGEKKEGEAEKKEGEAEKKEGEGEKKEGEEEKKEGEEEKKEGEAEKKKKKKKDKNHVVVVSNGITITCFISFNYI